MASSGLAAGLKALFMVLGFMMVATFIYTVAIYGLPHRDELLSPWSVATFVDFCINLMALVAWVSYKESNWFSALLWIILLVVLGSVGTCAYVLVQLLKLTSPDCLQDPMYHLLLRHSNQNAVECRAKYSPIIIARIAFSALGCLMLGTLLYTLFTYGHPFRKELLTPWMVVLLINFYINVVALSVWVFYKESGWISAIIWIILFICFGSIATCAYIVLQLSHLTSHDPLYLILLNNGNRKQV